MTTTDDNVAQTKVELYLRLNQAALLLGLARAVELLREWQAATFHEVTLTGDPLQADAIRLAACSVKTAEYLAQFEEGGDE